MQEGPLVVATVVLVVTSSGNRSKANLYRVVNLDKRMYEIVVNYRLNLCPSCVLVCVVSLPYLRAGWTPQISKYWDECFHWCNCYLLYCTVLSLSFTNTLLSLSLSLLSFPPSLSPYIHLPHLVQTVYRFCQNMAGDCKPLVVVW